MKRILLTIFGFGVLLSACSQTTLGTTSKKAKKYFEEASEAIRWQDFSKAIGLLTDAIETDPEFLDGLLTLGDLLYYQDDLEGAKNYMTKVIELDDAFSPKAHWILGMASMELEEFEAAHAAFTGYMGFGKLSSQSKKKGQRMLENSAFAKEAVKNPVPFNPEHFGAEMNSKDHESQPYLSADNKFLFFTRLVGGKQEDFYVSSFKDGAWKPAINLGSPINTNDWNEGSLAISPDANRMYYAGNYMPVGQQDWNIYYSEWNGRAWSRGEPLSAVINSTGYESMPSISADGKSIYFTSVRDNGYGGRDIWVSHKMADGRWGKAVNLGENINTEGHEEKPFIHADGRTLYFKSNGRVGMGGFDLYMVQKDENGVWGEPENLGYPINTPFNEGSLFVSTDGQKAFFDSDRRTGMGGYDLYSFDMPPSIQPLPVTYVRAVVMDKTTEERLVATVDVVELKSNTAYTSVTTTQHAGDFLIPLPTGNNYALNVSLEGYMFASENIALSKSMGKEDPQEMVILLEPIKVGASVALQNIFFETAKSDLTDASYPELKKLVRMLNDYPSMELEISGHTDNVGGVAFNQKLSEDRAKAVVEYLIKQDISAERLKSKGYGSTMPIASNDMEEGRAQNRRTEMKVLGM